MGRADRCSRGSISGEPVAINNETPPAIEAKPLVEATPSTETEPSTPEEKQEEPQVADKNVVEGKKPVTNSQHQMVSELSTVPSVSIKIQMQLPMGVLTVVATMPIAIPKSLLVKKLANQITVTPSGIMFTFSMILKRKFPSIL